MSSSNIPSDSFLFFLPNSKKESAIKAKLINKRKGKITVSGHPERFCIYNLFLSRHRLISFIINIYLGQTGVPST
jgi:hypothetical protein